MKFLKITFTVGILGVILGLLYLFANGFVFDAKTLATVFLFCLSIILTIQGCVTLFWMLYAWNNPEDIENHRSPKNFTNPQLSFTALVPARHEEKVIKDTIRSIDRINYPEHLKEVLVLCRIDDSRTIAAVEECIAEINKDTIRLVVFDSFPINKPHALNYGLEEANNQIVTIFDAEDEPHPDIYNIVNTTMLREKVAVVQSGVQLMNYRSRWFSALNVMEYFLWFKSGLHCFSRIGKVTPLGGNTVFFSRKWLKYIGGWDENCLTEDADVGIRLVNAGAKVKVIYDESHATREETPDTVSGFVKQRTRWNQGFLQIIAKGDWLKLPQLRQKIIALYILTSPLLQAILFLYMPLGILLAFTQKISIFVTLLSFIPLYLFALQLLIQIVGLYLFIRAYKLKFDLLFPLRVLLSFYPYQLLLIFAAFRAVYRTLLKRTAWEKTAHSNAHRQNTNVSLISSNV